MKNQITLVCLALMVMTPWRSQAVTPASDELLRTRVHDFTQALMKEKYEDAAQHVDPDLVKTTGKDALKNAGKEMMQGIKRTNEAFGRRLTGFKIDKVTIGKDKVSADV